MFSLSDFRAAMRQGAYAWPGGYPLYFIMSDGEALSFEAARANLGQIIHAIHYHDRSGWRIVGIDINWEDDTLLCSHTGKPIPSAYDARQEAGVIVRHLMTIG